MHDPISQPTLSLIVPMHDESANLQALHQRICAILDPLGESWELICINDGSHDDTLEQLLALQRQDQRLVILDLTRRFGKEAALSAGIDHALGAAIIPLDADLQDPPELIPEMLAKWRSGYEVVLAVRHRRNSDGWLKRLGARLFYRSINHLSTVPIPADAGDFRLMARPVVNALRSLPERRRFMKGLFAWVGFRTTQVFYERPPRHAGQTQFSSSRLWNLALEGVTSFSQAPLHLASYLGFLVALLAFAYALKIVVDTLVFGNPVKGYSSLMVAVSFFSGVQLMALGVIGEYLGRVYEESKQRPVYLIRQCYALRASPKANNYPPAETSNSARYS